MHQELGRWSDEGGMMQEGGRDETEEAGMGEAHGRCPSDRCHREPAGYRGRVVESTDTSIT